MPLGVCPQCDGKGYFSARSVSYGKGRPERGDRRDQHCHVCGGSGSMSALDTLKLLVSAVADCGGPEQRGT